MDIDIDGENITTFLAATPGTGYGQLPVWWFSISLWDDQRVHHIWTNTIAKIYIYFNIFQYINTIHVFIYIYCMVTAPNDLDIFFGRPCFTPVAHIRTPFGKIGRRLVNQCDLEERSALCLAVIGRHSNMVQILLSSKVPSRGVGACFKGLGLGGLKGIYFYWPLAWWSWQQKTVAQFKIEKHF